MKRILASCLAIVALLVFASPARAATETLPAGTLIIPMDNQLQGGGNFNLRAYGLAVRLLHADVPLKWIINPTKGKDGVDFTAPASRIAPSNQGSANRSFRAGPIAIHPGFEAQAQSVINGYGNNIAVFQLTNSATVFVDATLLHQPKVAVFNQGGKAKIHTSVLNEAGLSSGAHYQVVNNANSIGANSCFTMATEPHSDNISQAAVNGLLNFLRSGGNFFGQCAAIRGYTQRNLLAGYATDGKLNGSMRFDNFSDPMAQFQGGLDDQGGSVKSFKLTSNPGKRIAYSSSDGGRYKAYVGRVTGVNTTEGGWVHYLAGHDYQKGNNIANKNGRRMLMNAVLRAAERPFPCGLSLGSDYRITKVVNNSTPSVGQNVTFTVNAINDGPFAAADVVVNDLLPTGLTYVSHNTSSGTYVPGTGVWTIGTLNSGASRTLTLTATATAAAIPSRTNTATITSSTPDSNTSNNTASATVTPRYADLRVVKSVNNSTQTVGQNVTFTIAATNLGAFNATGVTVNDLLPAGLSYVSHTASAGIYNPGSGVWSIGNLNNGVTRTLTLTATVTTAAIPSVTNTATISGNEYDPRSNNNSDVATVNPAISDLSIVKTVDNGSQDIGEDVVFTIVVTNNGPSNNSGVVVNDLLPTGLDYVSHTTSTGPYNPDTGFWSIGNLNNGASVTLIITANVNEFSVPSAVNTATVSGNIYDPNLNNNSNSSTVSPAISANLAVNKAVNDANPILGQTITFTINATNAGPLLGTGVVANDILPSGLAYVSHTTSSGTYTPGTGVWDIGNLGVNDGQTLSITATVEAAAVPTVTNTVTISGIEADPDLSDNTSSVDVIPSIAADLEVVKTVDDPNPVVGENVAFTITARNNGPDAGTGVLVQDLLPAGLLYVSHNASTGTYNRTSGAWNIGNLPVNQPKTLTITATTTMDAGAIITNTATISGIETDPTPGNNIDDSTISILSGADVAIVKSVDNSDPFIGEVVIFTLTVNNSGPENATGVVVTDTLPNGYANATNISGGGTLDGNVITWPTFNLPVGDTATFTFQATVVNPN